MNLLKWEMRKIWNPVILAALLIFGLIYYWMFPLFDIQTFGYNGIGEDGYRVAWELVERYGPTLEPEERAELDGWLEEEKEQFQAVLAQIPEAAALNLTDYDSFDAFMQSYYEEALAQDSQADMNLERLSHRIYNGSNWYGIEYLTDIMRLYDESAGQGALRVESRIEDGAPQAVIERTRQLNQPENAWGLMPETVRQNTRDYTMDLAVWSVLSVVILLSPTLVRDRLYRTKALQWSSRRGRATLPVQMWAGVISAFILTLVNLTAYAIPFLKKGALHFAQCRLPGIDFGFDFWFDWTYGEYLVILIGLILALSLGAAGMTLFLSQYSGNYIAMLLKALPLFVGVGSLFGSWLLDWPFYFRKSVSLWLPKGTELAAILIFVTVSAVLCIAACRRIKRKELL